MPRIVLNTRFNNSLLQRVQQPGFSDTFDRAAGQPLGLTSGEGKAWRYESTGATPVWRTSSGGAAVNVAGGSRNSAFVDALATDGKLSVLAASLGSYRLGGLVARYQDINNHIFVFQASDTSGLAIYKRVAGVATKIGDSSYIPANGDVYELELSGANIILRVNGSTKATALDAAFLGETRMGLLGTSTAFSMGWDNISFTPAA